MATAGPGLQGAGRLKAEQTVTTAGPIIQIPPLAGGSTARGAHGRQPLHQPFTLAQQIEQIQVAVVLEAAAANAEQLIPQGERRLRAIGAQGVGEDASRQQAGVHRGQPRQALLQLVIQAAAAVGAHHQLGPGIEQPHLQCRLQVDAAVVAQQQHGPCIAGPPQAQRVRTAHVADGQLTAIALGQHPIDPSRLALINAVDLGVEAHQGAQTGLPQPAQTTDQDHARAGIHGPASV